MGRNNHISDTFTSANPNTRAFTLRYAKGWGYTNAQLADYLGVSRQTILNWRTMATKPERPTLDTIFRGMFAGAEDLYDEN